MREDRKMNERIKELAQKAGVSFLMEDDHSMVMNGKDLEMFADLIIRECADVVADINQDYNGGSTTVNAAEEIKQHFGIE